MHKFSLIETKGISLWNRKTSETYLFDSLLSSSNLLETSNFLKVLENVKELANSKILGTLQNNFSEAEKLKQNDNIPEALIKLDYVIRKGPKSMDELKKSLILRANIFLSRGYIENAILDYEIFLHVMKDSEHLNYMDELMTLTDLYQQVGDYENFKLSLDKIKFLYDQLPKVKKNLKKNSMNSFRNRIKIFERRLKKFTISTVGQRYSNENNLYPFDGYKGSHDSQISSASVACTLKKYTANMNGVIANRLIPSNEIVILESCSLGQEFYSPGLHCDYCMQTSEFMYSCLECHAKSYCSLDCIKSDYDIHKYECIGYQNSLLLMLNSGLLFRIFIKTVKCLQKFVFGNHNKADDIHDFFETSMKKLIENIPDSKLRKVLSTKVNYTDVNNHELLTMITLSLRLTVFICEKCTILKEFFGHVECLKMDAMVFIASLLLRLQYQIKRNSIELSFSVQTRTNDLLIHVENNEKSDLLMENFKANPTNGNKRILEYYTHNTIEATTGAAKILVQHLHKNNKTSFKANNKKIKFLNKLSRLFVDDACKAQSDQYVINTNELNFTQKSEYLKNTAIYLLTKFDYFNFNKKNIKQQTVEGIFPTTRQFQHSCDPNLILILLKSGELLAKSIRNIQPGEELTISYGLHYKEIDKITRSNFLKKNNMTCNCKYCMDEVDYYEELNTIYCYNCRKLIGGKSKCMNCDIDKSYIERIYDSINQTLREDEQESSKEQNEEKFFKHLTTKMCMYFLMYPETNLKMFEMKMKLVEFCVYKNFVSDSFTMLRNLFVQTGHLFPQYSSSLISNYSNISEMLMHILKYNMSYNLDFVNANVKLFHEIVAYAIYIVRKEIELHDFIQLFNENTKNTLNNYQILMVIKQRLFYVEYPSKLRDLNDDSQYDIVPELYDDTELKKDFIVLHTNNSKDLKKEDLITLLKIQFFDNENGEANDIVKFNEIFKNAKSKVDENFSENSDELTNTSQTRPKISFRWDGSYIILQRDDHYEIVSDDLVNSQTGNITPSSTIEVDNAFKSEEQSSTFYEEVIGYFCDEIEDRHVVEKQCNESDFEDEI